MADRLEELAADRAKIAEWTRQWFETHAPATREDFDLITMLRDYRDHLLTPMRGTPVDLDDETWRKVLEPVIADSCARCGAPLDASGNCVRRQEGCQGGRGEIAFCKHSTPVSQTCSQCQTDWATKSRLIAAVQKGKQLGKKALYFGCWDRSGHFLHDTSGRTLYGKEKPSDLFWDDGLMDGGLLKNGKVPDLPDGRVFWTAGGLAYWYAFYWWDRSVDARGACNSGFYVRGFGAHEEDAAFAYACEQFPHVVKRQKFPLVLQKKNKPGASNDQSSQSED